MSCLFCGGDFIPSAMGWGMAVFNGLFGHVLPALLDKYNPGTLQSALMLIPIGLMFARELIKVHGEHGKRIFIFAFLVGGVFIHVFVIISASKLFSMGILGHIDANAWLFFWGTVAVFLPSKFLKSPKPATA